MRRSVQKISLLLIAALLAVVLAAGCAADEEQSVLPTDAPDTSGVNVPDKSGTQAVYIYMCGSDLETKNGAATKNIAEMLSADISENTSVVIETGGSKKWRDYDISPDNLSRYIIEDGELVLKETVKSANMGSPDTLSDFLEYCVTEYPAERMGVIFWDHGGGSIKGVCNDELFGMDSLSLNELEKAFSGLNVRFAFIGFDACLMATLDTAAVLSGYADYMIASEEIEPSEGWDYVRLLQSFDAGVTTEDFGKAVCDSYIEKCTIHEKEKMAMLSLFDLTKFGEMSKAFEAFSGGIRATADMQYGNFEIITALDKSAKFGGNSATEGYSNLVDLYNFAKLLEEYNEFAGSLCASIDEMIVYKVSGEIKGESGGVSFYYPVIYNENDLKSYLSVCSSDKYKSYLSDLFTDIPDTTIEFVDQGSVAEDGSFHISLTPESKQYVRSVEFMLFEPNDTDSQFIVMGMDSDIFKDWDTMEFHSNFRGIWVGIDGKPIDYYIVEGNDRYIIFSTDVLINGEETIMRFSFTYDDYYFNGGYYSFIGFWNGFDESGVVDKDIRQLKAGDEVQILPILLDTSDYTLGYTYGDTITVGENGLTISEVPLSKQYYLYFYCVRDIFDNAFFSSTAVFEMQYSYNELLENPLPDGEYAAKIVTIIGND